MPDWKAKWIWLPGLGDRPNSYVLFRRQFTPPPGRPKGATLHATAGHFCHIYLNGKLVGRGPDRCYFRRKIYHSYDVTRLLKPGNNTLAIHCHFLGRNQHNLMERHAEGPAGVIAQLDLDGKPFIWTDKSWKAKEDPAYSTETEVASMHREWREEYYAGRRLNGWLRADFDDSDWPNAEEIAPAEGGPWEKLIPKETPELTAEPVAPLNVYLTNPGSTHWEYDARLLYNLIDEKSAREKRVFSVWNGKHERQEILFDMGRVMVGYPKIEIADSLGGTIQIYYGDSLDMTHWDTIHLGQGPLTWTPFTLRGGRYFRLVITGAKNPIFIRSVRWVRTNYPVEKRGAFSSSDPRLDAIWRMCALTAETCGVEHFVDCALREQVLWMMDFRFQALQHYYYFGDTALARKCFRQFSTIQLKNGYILAYGPSCRPKEELESPKNGRKPHDWLGFNFYFILAAWEHYQYTQDKSFLAEILPVCKRSLDYYARAEKDGFADLGEIPGSYFVEWGYDVSIKGLSGFHQALYYGALKAYSRMCEAAGRGSDARSAAAKAAQLQRRFFQRFTDPKTGHVADYLSDGKRHIFKRTQPHSAVLLFFDNIPPKVRAACLDLIVNRKAPPSKSGVGTALTVCALFRHQHPEAALQLLSDYWGSMVDANLPQVPEFYDMNWPKGADCRWHPAYSRCHAYASLAGVILQQQLLGAHVEGNRVRLSPYFGKLDHAAGVVPTVAGDVRISWRRTPKMIELSVRAPHAVEVSFEPRHETEPVRFRRLFT